MQVAEKEILLMLKDDANDSDGYCCFEIIEPYVNANRFIELTDQEISQCLMNLVDKGAIQSFSLDKNSQVENWLPSKPTIKDAISMWYRITSSGLTILAE